MLNVPGMLISHELIVATAKVLASLDNSGFYKEKDSAVVKIELSNRGDYTSSDDYLYETDYSYNLDTGEVHIFQYKLDGRGHTYDHKTSTVNNDSLRPNVYKYLISKITPLVEAANKKAKMEAKAIKKERKLHKQIAKMIKNNLEDLKNA